jgi:enoyl-CoA hydratase/carnithine racemase
MSTPTTTFETLLYEVQGGVATITLNRPDKLNTLTTAMLGEILAAFDATDADDAVRAVIVTGAGKGFCAGADLSEAGGLGSSNGSAPAADAELARDRGGVIAMRIYASLKPVIGAINGAAVGVGATITLPMDVRLCSEYAKFGFVFARRGIVPEAASSWFLPRVVGISRAMEWCATGRIITAESAREAGLVRDVYAADDLLPAARALAREIADNTAPVSVALSRQMLWRMLSEQHPMNAHRTDSRAVALRRVSGDAKEGVASFIEKRSAEFPDLVSEGLPDIWVSGPPPAWS